MNKLFEIKYSIFENHKEEFKNMTLEEFEKDYNDIYGMFTLIFDGNKFIAYLDNEEEFSLETRSVFSELIPSYFDALIYIIKNLDNFPCLFLKYIENSTTWLRLDIKETEIIASEIEIEWNNEMNTGFSNSVSKRVELFEKINEKSWGDISISKNLFKEEVIKKLYSFIQEINDVNPSLLRSRVFSKHIEFLQDNGIEIISA
ncbi:hypothetical protein ACFIJ5_05650 [Haloimpatiens sp. FM7330]|uniref:hypothetical protein n=1 Tax=Haloimpatiens sp. FM7330 TaxID=3298610 RepID=UPI00363788C7